MNSIQNHRTRVLAAILLVTLSAALAACSLLGGSAETGNVQAGGNPLPTERPTEAIGEEARSQAKDTPQGTWEGYLRDMIAYQQNQIAAKMQMFQRYENPEQTAQNTGLVKEVSLIEDRTTWVAPSGDDYVAQMVDFDVRVTFLNGDSDTWTCTFQVEMQFDDGDGVWYVVGPKGLDIYTFCAR